MWLYEFYQFWWIACLCYLECWGEFWSFFNEYVWCVCFDVNWNVIIVNWCLNDLIDLCSLGGFGIWSIDTPFYVLKLFWTKVLMKEYQFRQLISSQFTQKHKMFLLQYDVVLSDNFQRWMPHFASWSTLSNV